MNKKWKILILWASIIIFLDQLSKYFVHLYLPQGTTITVFSHFFDLVHYRNPGAAFGMFVSWTSPWRSVFLFAVSLFAFVFLLYYYHRTPLSQKIVLFSLSLIFGGAIGNMIDRIFRGTVIDFVLLHWGDKVTRFEFFGKSYQLELVWPAFNVADSAITVGVVLLLIINIFGKSNSPS